MEINEKKIRKLLGFGRKKYDDRVVIAKCRVCGEPLLGVTFLKRYRDGKLKMRERLVIKQLLLAGKLGLQSAKLVGIDVSHLQVGDSEKDVIGGILSFHFTRRRDKKHQKICQAVIDVGDSGPILANIDWNEKLKKEYGLDADW